MCLVASAFILGPSRIDTLNTSSLLIHSLLAGKVPYVPRIAIPVIDIRDSAKYHILAMENIDKLSG